MIEFGCNLIYTLYKFDLGGLVEKHTLVGLVLQLKTDWLVAKLNRSKKSQLTYGLSLYSNLHS
jgi:hypothetical protein